jgi:hypothetical protein
VSKRTTLEDPGAVLAYALSLANLHYDRHRIVEALLSTDQIVELQRRTSATRTRRQAEHDATKALRRASESPLEDWPVQVPIRIAQIREVADSQPWPGRTGPTDRRVLEAGFSTGILAHSKAFRCSVRTWAVRAGVPPSVTSTSIARLIDLHWLRRTHPADRLELKPARYSLGVGTRTDSPPEATVRVRYDLPAIPIQTSWSWLSHDSFRRAALGDAGWMVLRRLDAVEPITNAVIAWMTGMDPRRTYSVLGRLVAFDLARRIPDGWVRVGDDELVPLLDALAVACHTSGALVAQRARDEVARQRERAKRDERQRVSEVGQIASGILKVGSDLLEVDAEFEGVSA